MTYAASLFISTLPPIFTVLFVVLSPSKNKGPTSLKVKILR
jgi:hypothetical protein